MEQKENKQVNMTTRAAILLGSIVVGTIFEFASGTGFFISFGVIFAMILVWSLTFRFFLNPDSSSLGIVLNTLLASALAIYSRGLTSELLLLHLSVVGAGLIGLSAMRPDGYSFRRADFVREIVMPSAAGFIASGLACGIMYFFQMRNTGIGILFAALVLIIISFFSDILFGINLRFTSVRLTEVYDIKFSGQRDLIIFVRSRLILFVLSLCAFIVSVILEKFLPIQNEYKIPAIVIVSGIIFFIYSLFSGSNSDENVFKSKLLPYESIIFAAFINYPIIKTAPIGITLDLIPRFPMLAARDMLLIILLIICDFTVVGLIGSYNRKLIFAKRGKCVDGLPFYLVVTSILIMVGNCFFMLY